MFSFYFPTDFSLSRLSGDFAVLQAWLPAVVEGAGRRYRENITASLVTLGYFPPWNVFTFSRSTSRNWIKIITLKNEGTTASFI